MKRKFNPMLLLMGMLSTGFVALAQDVDEDLFTLSLEELMNVPINSASKRAETLFDAPLSSYTITKADIDKAGSTSIMEALRLAPGVIVREQTNGVYDIHIRGFDNVLRQSETYTTSNLATLVMIDNRPVFNHNLGGTFWEALPIDLNDVERIEIVRGPSAPLFGPNAVTGVINIITKRLNSNKTMVNANAQLGNRSTQIANTSIGKNFGKVSAIVSGNYQKRERFDDTYYRPSTNQFYTVGELNEIIPANPFSQSIINQYPDPGLAMERYGANAFVTIKAADQINFDISTGIQRAETQKIFLSNAFNGGMLFTNNKTETNYINVASTIYGLTLRTSYLTGYDNLALAASPNQYDYKVTDLSAEYAIGLGKVGNLVPGLSYQRSAYGDEAYVGEGLLFLNGEEVTISTSSAFVRTDLKPIESLRIIAALRVDRFSSPDDAYLAYELATTYKLNESNLIRAAITRSNSGSFIGNNFLNLSVPTANPGVSFLRSGNENLNLFRVDMIEFGYRSKLSKQVQLDIDVFQQKAENFTALILTSPVSQEFKNIPTTATQRGITLSLNIVPVEKLQFKPFITLQSTETSDLPSSYNDPAIDPSVTYSTTKNKNTPGFYGGYFLNYKVTKALNVNINGYYFGAHQQGATGLNDINGKVLVNAKVSYTINNVSIFLNGRNALNNNSREFFGADRTAGLYTAGLSYNLLK